MDCQTPLAARRPCHESALLPTPALACDLSIRSEKGPHAFLSPFFLSVHSSNGIRTRSTYNHLIYVSMTAPRPCLEPFVRRRRPRPRPRLRLPRRKLDDVISDVTLSCLRAIDVVEHASWVAQVLPCDWKVLPFLQDRSDFWGDLRVY